MDNSAVLLERLRQEERREENMIDIHKIRRKINNLKQHVRVIPFSNDENDIELQHVLMNQIRNLQMRENDIIANQNRRASVYNDTQNVHNSEINDSVINIDNKYTGFKLGSDIIFDCLSLIHCDYYKIINYFITLRISQNNCHYNFKNKQINNE